jgi:HEAT repeat protein
VQPLVKWAVESFACLKVEEVVPQLVGLLKDEHAGVRWVAIVALSRVGRGSAEAVAAVRASLQDRDDKVRGAAVWALSQIEGTVVREI